MSTVAVQEEVRIPTWVIDLESFRRWARSDEFPERGRFSHLGGGLRVDLSMECFAHNQAKATMSRKLGDLIEAGGLGYFCPDGMQLVNVEADLSTEPDGVFIGNKTFDAGPVCCRHCARCVNAHVAQFRRLGAARSASDSAAGRYFGTRTCNSSNQFCTTRISVPSIR